MSAYSAVIFAFLIFIFLPFTYFNYVFIIAALGSIVFSVGSWQGKNLEDIQVVQVFFGAIISTEIIYYSSVYACHGISKNFPRLTCYIRAVPLCAKITSAILAQVLVTNECLSYQELAFLSVPACVHATTLLLHLPPMCDLLDEPPRTFLSKYSWFKTKFIESFEIKYVLKWSLWSAFTFCGYTRISTILEAFWKKVELENNDTSLNGAIVDGISAFLSLIGVILSGTRANAKFGNALLCITSVLQGVLLFALGNVNDVWSYSICQILYEIVYQLVIASVSAMIAARVYHKGSYAVVFGFIGLIFAICNLIFVCIFSSDAIGLTLKDEIMILGGYHFVVAALIILLWLIKM